MFSCTAAVLTTTLERSADPADKRVVHRRSVARTVIEVVLTSRRHAKW